MLHPMQHHSVRRTSAQGPARCSQRRCARGLVGGARAAVDGGAAATRDATADILQAVVEYSLRVRLKEHDLIEARVRSPAPRRPAVTPCPAALARPPSPRAPPHSPPMASSARRPAPTPAPTCRQVDCDALGVLEGRFRSMAISGEGWCTPLGMTARRLEVRHTHDSPAACRVQLVRGCMGRRAICIALLAAGSGAHTPHTHTPDTQ